MISKFCPVGHLILIFIRRILPPLELFELSKKCSSTVYTRSVLDLVRQFFLKMMLAADMSEWGDKKFQRGESTMDDAMSISRFVPESLN